MRSVNTLFLIGALTVFAGCASSASSVLTRNEMNTNWSLIKRVKGIPITVKVPTHVKLYVYEKYFLQEVDLAGGLKEIRPVMLDVPVRDFAQDFIYTEKVIMVDFKRPAAGAFNLDLDLTEDQYIEKVQHDVTDETIQRVTELVGQLAPSGIIGAPSSGAPGENIDPKIKEIKSVVAVGVFEVDAPDFELQVSEFLNCHLNKSHDAYVTPPWVEKFHRPAMDRTSIDPALCPEGDCYPMLGSSSFHAIEGVFNTSDSADSAVYSESEGNDSSILHNLTYDP